VDLLPDRQAATLKMWLKQHPGVQLISRDRAGEFARGAKEGAAEALQAADRFHVLRNLAEVAQKVRGLASSDVENHSGGDNSSTFSIPIAPASTA
jgi:transposase